MSSKYLVINAGSSSLKFSLYNMPEAKEIVNGLVERIGSDDSTYSLKYNGKKIEKNCIISNHTEAIKIMFGELLNNHFIDSPNDIVGVGHRVLHGGDYYSDSVVIDDEVMENIKELSKFGPLHHPGEIAGIESMQKYVPTAKEVAVFDTAFHQTIPKEHYMYALPYEWYEKNNVRKYGFHGTSHKYITEIIQNKLEKKDVNVIICHLGSGSSISCIKNGICFDTSMGMTPLDGLIMGTRCGSIDSSILEYISKEKNLSIEEITSILNNQSGLLGIAGKNDFRDVEALAKQGNERAILALNMLKNSILNFIIKYYAELDGNVDAIVFTAGMGENAISLRESIVSSFPKYMNIKLDKSMNDEIARFKENQSGIISTLDSKNKVFVIPTNEEYMILRDTYDLCQKENSLENQKVFK